MTNRSAIVRKVLKCRSSVFPGDSPVEVQAAYFLEALSRQYEESARDLIENHFTATFREAFPVEEHLRQITSMREQLGEFQLLEIRRMDDFSAELVLVSPQSNSQYKASLMVDRQSPHRIAGLFFERSE